MRARRTRYVSQQLADRAGSVEHGRRLHLVVSAYHAGTRSVDRRAASVADAETTAQLLAGQGYEVHVSLGVAA